MRKSKRRITLYLEDRAADLLVIDLDTRSVNYALNAFANLVAQSTNKLGAFLTPLDWLYLSRALAGLDMLPSLPAGNLAEVVRNEVSSAARLDGLAREVWPVDPAGNLKLLVEVVNVLSELEAYALVVAVRHRWRTAEVDDQAEEWWRVSHRLRPSVKDRRIAAD